MEKQLNHDLEDVVLSNNAKPLSSINVGVINGDGIVQEVITLEELARVGCSQPIQMHNYANFGEVEYEFTVSDNFNLCDKVAYWREQQNSKNGGKQID